MPLNLRSGKWEARVRQRNASHVRKLELSKWSSEVKLEIIYRSRNSLPHGFWPCRSALQRKHCPFELGGKLFDQNPKCFVQDNCDLCHYSSPRIRLPFLEGKCLLKWDKSVISVNHSPRKDTNLSYGACKTNRSLNLRQLQC